MISCHFPHRIPSVISISDDGERIYLTFFEKMIAEGTKRAKAVIKQWKESIIPHDQELRDVLETIAFRSRPDAGKITLDESRTIFPGAFFAPNSTPYSYGTIGSICKISSGNDNFASNLHDLCAITCGHVVGTEDVECLVCTGQPDRKLTRLGRSDVVIKPDSYQKYTVDTCGIAVENEDLRFGPFTNQAGNFVKLSPEEFREGPKGRKEVRKSLVGRHVQKIGAKTNLTYGRVKDYYMRLLDGQNIRTMYNVIEIEWIHDNSGVKQFTQNGDSGAVITDVLDGSVQNPCAIGIHIGRYENGDHASSICSPLQVALGALSAGLSHKYQQQLKVELLAPGSCFPGSAIPRNSGGFRGSDRPAKRTCIREES